MSYVCEIFAETLDKFISNNRITVAEINKKTTISRTLIGQYRNGTKKPGLKNADKIANACGMTLIEFLGGSGNVHIHPTDCARALHEHFQNKKKDP